LKFYLVETVGGDIRRIILVAAYSSQEAETIAKGIILRDKGEIIKITEHPTIFDYPRRSGVIYSLAWTKQEEGL